MKKMPLGATYRKESTFFRVFAPFAKEVAVRLLGEFTKEYLLEPKERGFYEGEIAGDLEGKSYTYLLDESKERPDPASRFQPKGVHGPSCVVNPQAFSWTDDGWKGIDLKDFVIYETHVGTFTPSGDFEGVIDKLAYLKDLGVTAIELMPVAQFPGERNWGYDGVYPFAVQNSYGGPLGLKKLVDAAHGLGLAVVLDVMFNHLGPEGNYLGDFGPYFTDRYKTPWGLAINFDGQDSDIVRDYFIQNALYWLLEYHIDALRLDAVHAIFDMSAKHFLKELSMAFHRKARSLGRKAFLVAESDLNDVRLLKEYGLDAQWNDDFHHVVHAQVTGKKNGYFADFVAFSDLPKAIKSGFVNDWRFSTFRGRFHGSSSKSIKSERMVACIQNHDQVGNACRGSRLGDLIDTDAREVAASILAFSPSTPLLFMGEEWDAKEPFYYFTSHGDPDLAEAVRRGYQKECMEYGFHGAAIDPQDESVFLSSKLDWDNRDMRMLSFYRTLLAWRKRVLLQKRETKVDFTEDPKSLCVFRDSDAFLLCSFDDALPSRLVFLQKGVWELMWSNREKACKIELETDMEYRFSLPPWTCLAYFKEA